MRCAQPALPGLRGARALALACAAALAACAGGRSEAPMDEFRAQLREQGELISRQARRIEQLELRVAALGSEARPAAAAPAEASAPAAPPAAAAPSAGASADRPAPAPPRKLQTVKLPPPSGRRLHERRLNPVERAPRLPAQVELKEPDEAALAELDQPLPSPSDAALREQAAVDRTFAEAVGLLNDGQYHSAQAAFLAFAAKNPKHPALDHAFYYAGLSRAAAGDCAGALAHFSRAAAERPQGTAALSARLERGRCLLQTGQRAEGRDALELLIKDQPASPEAAQAQRLLAAEP